MSFEDRLGELLKNEDPQAAGPDPALVIVTARRRRARRRTGIGAAVLAVALVCGATAVTAGNTGPAGPANEAGAIPSGGPVTLAPAAPSPTATATASPQALPLPVVKQVAPGEKVQVAADFRISVTRTERCDELAGQDGRFVAAPVCRDSTSDNLSRGEPVVYCQLDSNLQRDVEPCMYLGPAPAKIVKFVAGKPVPATLIVTPGMENWTAFYFTGPSSIPRMRPGTARVPSDPIGVYDAQDRLLASSDGMAPDGSPLHVPTGR
ncbi:hypothetical protein ACWCXH_02045 [Kitasatospora sp. NPDC001660]